MKKLFWGFFFILLEFHFNTTVNGAVTHSVDVLPDVVGWVLLLAGLREMEAESALFGKLRPFALAMAVYTGVLWVDELMGWFSQSGLLAILALVVELYVTWALVVAVRDVEERRGADLNSRSMKRAWTLLLLVSVVQIFAVGLVLGVLGALLSGSWGLLALLAGVAAVWGIAVLVAGIWYLLALRKSAKAYALLPPPGGAWQGPEFL